MITVKFTSTTDTREQLKQFKPQSAVCQCGGAKQTKHAVCPNCARHIGPYVIVESPSGDYIEVGGLESAESLLQRNGNSTVQGKV